MIKRPPILILDEPTSAVDGGSAKMIWRAVSDLDWQPTLIVITHQFSSFMAFDQVFTLKKGKILEQEENHAMPTQNTYLHAF